MICPGPSTQTISFLGSLLLFSSVGCVHHIHVDPTSPATTERPIADSVQVIVSFLALEGADHMPGIALLDWPAKDLRSAAINYIRQRGTFASVGEKPGNLRLTLRAWMKMKSRRTYVYTLRLESDLGPSDKPSVKSYVVEKEADGSIVRWVTASDQDPIERTVQAALDDLLQRIENDAALYGKRPN